MPGGIRIKVGSAPRSGTETPRDLLKEFDDTASSAPLVLLATLGPEQRAYHLTVLVRSRDSIKVRLRLPSVEDAKALHSWLADALARGKQDGLSALDAIKPTLHQNDITVDVAAGIPLAMGIRAAVMEAFNFPTASMAPTVLMGDHFFVAKGAFAKVAARGDLAAFRAPEGRQIYLKRVVGVGGDRVQIKDGKLSLNGTAIATQLEDSSYEYDDLDEESGKAIRRTASLWREEIDGHPFFVMHTEGALDEAVDITVPAGHVYVLGDNRQNSLDSRHFGPVPLSEITGRATVLWWSKGSDGIRWDRIGQFVDAATTSSQAASRRENK
jgi:signal peptidase I